MVSEDNSHNIKAAQRNSKDFMKKQRQEETIHGSSAGEYSQKKLDGSSLTVYDDGLKVKVVYEVSTGDVRTMENGAQSQKRGLCQVTSKEGQRNVPSPSEVITNGRGHIALQAQKASKDSISTLLCDASSSQPWSGPEDNSTEPHDTLTETSTMTFVDAQTIDESGETHSLLGKLELHIKEFVLIDDDDDGDMSLREKTVTDLSIMDGNAADLVCGRLLSITTETSSECKEESLAPETSPPTQTDSHTKKQRCCFCSIL